MSSHLTNQLSSFRPSASTGRPCRAAAYFRRYIEWGPMENYSFIDRFFHSQYELLDLTKAVGRDSNTLYTFLNNLHTTADRLKEEFDCDIKGYPEFKILRLIRNYFHHVGDV